MREQGGRDEDDVARCDLEHDLELAQDQEPVLLVVELAEDGDDAHAEEHVLEVNVFGGGHLLSGIDGGIMHRETGERAVETGIELVQVVVEEHVDLEQLWKPELEQSCAYQYTELKGGNIVRTGHVLRKDTDVRVVEELANAVVPLVTDVEVFGLLKKVRPNLIPSVHTHRLAHTHTHTNSGVPELAVRALGSRVRSLGVERKPIVKERDLLVDAVDDKLPSHPLDRHGLDHHEQALGVCDDLRATTEQTLAG